MAEHPIDTPAPPDQVQPPRARVCRPANLWQEVVGVFYEVLEKQPGRLLEEAGFLAIWAESQDDLVWQVRALHDLDPLRAMALFRQMNPGLHLHSLNTLDDEQKYNIAVGLLRFFTDDDDAYVRDDEQAQGEVANNIVDLADYCNRGSE